MRIADALGVTLTELLVINDPVIAFFRGVLVVDFVLIAAMYWFLFTKHSKFRVIASLLLLAWWPTLVLAAAATHTPDIADLLFRSSFPWVISCAIWVTYLNRAKRVRVTFEHAVLADPPVPPSPNRQPEMSHMTHQRPVNESSMATITSDHTSVIPYHPFKSPTVHTGTNQPMRYTPDTTPFASASIAASTPNLPIAINATEPSEDNWAQALAELEGGTRRAGVWAKAFAEAQGHDATVRAIYLRDRARQLADADEAVKKEQESKRAAAAAELAAERAAAIAATNSELGSFRSTLTAGRHLSTQEVTALVWASRKDKMLIELSDRMRGETLLHWCAKHGLYDDANELLNSGANPNAMNGDGRRPFELAEDNNLRTLLFKATTLRVE